MELSIPRFTIETAKGSGRVVYYELQLRYGGQEWAVKKR